MWSIYASIDMTFYSLNLIYFKELKNYAFFAHRDNIYWNLKKRKIALFKKGSKLFFFHSRWILLFLYTINKCNVQYHLLCHAIFICAMQCNANLILLQHTKSFYYLFIYITLSAIVVHRAQCFYKWVHIISLPPLQI